MCFSFAKYHTILIFLLLTPAALYCLPPHSSLPCSHPSICPSTHPCKLMVRDGSMSGMVPGAGHVDMSKITLPSKISQCNGSEIF